MVPADEHPWESAEFCRALTALIRDEGFQRYMQQAPYEYDGCEGAPPPEGLDASVAEELVVFARRLRAIPFIGEGMGAGSRAFWVVSPAMYRDLFALVARTEGTSGLWCALEPLERRREIRRFVARDLEAAATRDGVAVDREALYGLVCDGAPPRTDGERLMVHTLGLLDQGVAVPGSLRELQGLWESVAGGFEAVASYPRYRMAVGEMLGVDDWAPPTIDGLWEYLEHVDRRELHPLLGILFVSDLMFDAGPFGRLNALTEVVLRHALARHLGLPALRHIPLSAIRLDWETGLYPQRYGRPYGKAVTPGPYGADSTLMLRESIGFLRHGLGELQQAVDAVLAQDDRRCARVEADWRLNPRQKELLCELVRDPAQVVDALGYEKRFGVAMSTAHTDLGSLARLGLLRAQTVGRKQVYRLDDASLGE